MTPYENHPPLKFINYIKHSCKNNKIKSINSISKRDSCISFLKSNGTYPYYYMYNNIINIIYLSHISINSNRGISINIDNNLNSGIFNETFQNNLNYTCENQADFNKNFITYYDEYRIELPINYNKTIILKSMNDIDNLYEQNTEMICQIFEDSFQKSKPIQISNLEKDSSIHNLFKRLFNLKNSNDTFEGIINDTCDTIDNILFPYCKDSSNIIFEFGECNEKTNKMSISYKNCKLDDSIPEFVDCLYIPNFNYLGLIIEISIIISLFIELVLFILVIIKRNERDIYASGLKYILTFIFLSMLLSISIYFWIGPIDKYKCILRISLMLISMNGLTCIYSIKSEYIISIYYNNNLKSINYKYKTYFLYLGISFTQIILLCIWILYKNGIENRIEYLEKIGNFNNEMTLYYLCIFYNIKRGYAFFLILMIIFSLIINVIFIIPKLYKTLNENKFKFKSIIMVNNINNNNSNLRVTKSINY
ncbi:hypothetical protein H8356DRAFT_1267991 [Neocallimastix lanati (nom. inval.)]|nr:hypothetical protein H8356DRAFT_1267991 [Neocallimastix sp. JGI-2020a]